MPQPGRTACCQALRAPSALHVPQLLPHSWGPTAQAGRALPTACCTQLSTGLCLCVGCAHGTSSGGRRGTLHPAASCPGAGSGTEPLAAATVLSHRRRCCSSLENLPLLAHPTACRKATLPAQPPAGLLQPSSCLLLPKPTPVLQRGAAPCSPRPIPDSCTHCKLGPLDRQGQPTQFSECCGCPLGRAALWPSPLAEQGSTKHSMTSHPAPAQEMMLARRDTARASSEECEAPEAGRGSGTNDRVRASCSHKSVQAGLCLFPGCSQWQWHCPFLSSMYQ